MGSAQGLSWKRSRKTFDPLRPSGEGKRLVSGARSQVQGFRLCVSKRRQGAGGEALQGLSDASALGGDLESAFLNRLLVP